MRRAAGGFDHFRDVEQACRLVVRFGPSPIRGRHLALANLGAIAICQYKELTPMDGGQYGASRATMRPDLDLKAASVANRAPPYGGGASGGALPLRARTTAADPKRDARAA